MSVFVRQLRKAVEQYWVSFWDALLEWRPFCTIHNSLVVNSGFTSYVTRSYWYAQPQTVLEISGTLNSKIVSGVESVPILPRMRWNTDLFIFDTPHHSRMVGILQFVGWPMGSQKCVEPMLFLKQPGLQIQRTVLVDDWWSGRPLFCASIKKAWSGFGCSCLVHAFGSMQQEAI